jgi:hypothetical protein
VLQRLLGRRRGEGDAASIVGEIEEAVAALGAPGCDSALAVQVGAVLLVGFRDSREVFAAAMRLLQAARAAAGGPAPGALHALADLLRQRCSLDPFVPQVLRDHYEQLRSVLGHVEEACVE